MTTMLPSSGRERPAEAAPLGDRTSSGAAGPGRREPVDEPLRPLRIHVPVAMLALGLLVGLLVWGGPRSSGGAASAGPPAASHRIDFNEPATLAWSVQLVGPEADALRDVTCSTVGHQTFICQGRLPDGTEATLRVHVAERGTSWTSE